MQEEQFCDIQGEFISHDHCYSFNYTNDGHCCRNGDKTKCYYENNVVQTMQAVYEGIIMTPRLEFPWRRCSRTEV